MQTTDRKWYVLYTRTNFEKKVNLEIAAKEMESYLPVKPVWKKWSDRTKRLYVPLFPNYVFVKISLYEKSKLLSIPGVIKLITVDSKPVSISELEVEKVRRLVNSNCEVSLEVERYAGMKVRVVSGVFAGLEGEIVKMSNRIRFLVKLNTINQALSVDMEQTCVERIS